MSNRILISLILALSAGTAGGESGESGTTNFDQTGFGLRYSSSDHFHLNLTLAPLTERDDFIGPVYHTDIGATRLTFSLSF